jgi:subtilisin family serine protease
MRFKPQLVAFFALLALVTALSLPAAASPTGKPADGRQAPRIAAPDDAHAAIPELRPPFTIAARAAASALEEDGPTYYILHLADAPLARYGGELDELPATSPRATGTSKLAVTSPASVAYLAYLAAAQNEIVATIERSLGRKIEVLHRYRYAFNGISVWLSPAEAARVAKIEGVIKVERNKVEKIETDVGPRLIGAPAIWEGTGTGGLPGTRGEGVIVGIIDTGINMDHPSFAATGPVDGFAHTNPRGSGNYLGWCNPGNPNYDPKYVCNAKLIGAWSYPDSSMDPEDENGHGTHTSSTAAGNVVQIAVPSVSIERNITGVAPHANIVIYDACTGGGCNSTATTAAIDQAAADGVDVLNYSISIGRDSPWFNSRLVAFLGAYEAGVFVAASAGNAGPIVSTTNATAPWITSVAATTQGRTFVNALINLSGGDTPAPADIIGAGFTGGYGPAKVVYAAGALKANGMPDDGTCLEAFPAGTWNGEIVVCDRGTIARLLKGQNVKDGGAGGFVLANVPSNGAVIFGDAYSLPGINITANDAQVLKTWLASGTGHMGSIRGVTPVEDPAAADHMARFSSRGPALTGICCPRQDNDDAYLTYFDVLKPDIGGPGADILAAWVVDETSTLPEFNIISGTSMSSPHLAGSGALIKALHPTWSPSQIQSALILTAKNEGILKEDGSTIAGPFDIGAGRVDLTKAGQSGFVLDVTGAEFQAADPDKGGQPSTLNIASMTDAWSFGASSWQRRLVGTASAATTWTVTVQPVPGQAALPAGVNITVNPSSFTLAPGAGQTLSVQADVAALPLNTWAYAQVVLTAEGGTSPTAHMPVVIRHTDKRIPPFKTIYTDKTTGREMLKDLLAPEVTELTIDTSGLVPGLEGTAMIPVDPTNDDPYDSPEGTFVITRTVPADARRLIAEVTGSSARDIDMLVGRDANGNGRPELTEQVCSSGRESWDEFCNIIAPPAGVWWVMLINFEGSATPPDSVDYVTGVVPVEDAKNMTVTGPATVPAYEAFDLTIDWNLPSIAPGDRWYGAIRLGTSPATRFNLGQISVDIIGIGEVATPTPTTAPPTATPTQAPPTATPTRTEPTPTPLAPTATSVPPTAVPTPAGMCVCGLIQNGGQGVPQASIDAAVANPAQVNGWMQPLIPGKPVGPFNPLRTCLSIQNISQRYNPLFNSLVFKAGCP